MKKIALKNATRGTAFDYAGQSWILLENDDGRALCLSKDIIETEPLTRETATTSPSPAARNTSTVPTSTTCSRT